MKYKAKKRCSKNIVKFYLNVSRKFKHMSLSLNALVILYSQTFSCIL